MKLAVIVGFVTKMLPYIKLVKDGDFGNLVEGVGVSFSYIYFGGCFGHKCAFVVFLRPLVEHLIKKLFGCPTGGIVRHSLRICIWVSL